MGFFPWAHLTALTPKVEAIFGHVPKGWTVLCDTHVSLDLDVPHRVAEMIAGQPTPFVSNGEELWKPILATALRMSMPICDWSDSARLEWILFRIDGFHWQHFPESVYWTKGQVAKEAPPHLDNAVQLRVRQALVKSRTKNFS